MLPLRSTNVIGPNVEARCHALWFVVKDSHARKEMLQAFKETFRQSLYLLLGLNWKLINPLSPRSDQHQIAPHDINTQSREKVVRILIKCAPKRNCFDLLTNSPN